MSGQRWQVDLSGGLSAEAACITCGSPNLEANAPRKGECTCRDCGEEMDVREANKAATVAL